MEGWWASRAAACLSHGMEGETGYWGSEGDCHQCCTGIIILENIFNLPPIFRIDSPSAIAQFDHPGYYNSCTMKSCCFAGPDDEFVMSGSDDFNVYMWGVPGEGDTCPQWVPRARHVLSGHRSIVNQVRIYCHRSLYHILAPGAIQQDSLPDRHERSGEGCEGVECVATV